VTPGNTTEIMTRWRLLPSLRRWAPAMAFRPGSCLGRAGHDTMAMGKLCPAGMLFVRCKGGVSNNPLELITVEDCAIGLKALTQFTCDFAPIRSHSRGVDAMEDRP
jgi:hypothetical protein